jgi:hypothetical protein
LLGGDVCVGEGYCEVRVEVIEGVVDRTPLIARGVLGDKSRIPEGDAAVSVDVAAVPAAQQVLVI